MRRKSKFTRLAREMLGLALLAVKLAAAIWDLVSKAVDWTGLCIKTSNGHGNVRASISSLRPKTQIVAEKKSSIFATARSIFRFAFTTIGKAGT